MSIDKLERSNRRLDAAVPVTPSHSSDGPIAAGDECRQYAVELAARFEAYVGWANDHWPLAGQPLTPASFEQSRRELEAICRQAGAPLDRSADPASSADLPAPDVPGGAQFVPVTPMPWP